MNKFRLLRPDEIECRISTINENGLSLLLYKTARTDANLLDETVGSENWENDFKVVDGVLYGGIGIYDTQLDRWVWKWDAGVESKTEAEKGRASDAFKRAGFKHGIGRELYSAPFIWLTPDKYELKENKGRYICYDRFSVSEISYSEQGEITKLVITNDKKGVDVYTYPKFAQKVAKNENSSSDIKVSTQNKESASAQTIAPREAPDGYYYCENCGNQLSGTTLPSGKRIDHHEVAKRTIKKYGRQLCEACCKDAKPVA